MTQARKKATQTNRQKIKRDKLCDELVEQGRGGSLELIELRSKCKLYEERKKLAKCLLVGKIAEDFERKGGIIIIMLIDLKE